MNLQGWPQLWLLAIVDMYLELAISYDQIDAYSNCHQKAFIKELMGTNANIHSHTLDGAQESC